MSEAPMTIVGIGHELLGLAAAMDAFKAAWTNAEMIERGNEIAMVEHKMDYLDTQFWMDASEYRARLRTLLLDQKDKGLAL